MAPNEPNKKPVTLDLDLKQPDPPEPKPQEPTEIKFRDLNATVQRQEKTRLTPPRPLKTSATRTRIKRNKKAGNPAKSLFIGAGVLITGLLLSRYFGVEPMPDMAPSAPTPALSAKTAKAVRTDALPKAPPPPERLADPHAGMRLASLDQLGTQVDAKGNTSFAVRVKPKPVCHPGDVEAMRNVVGPNGSLLLSLEPMSGNKPPITRTISLKEIIEGTKVSLPVNLKDTGVYGIYICGDSSNSRSCGGKKAADFNRILNHKNLEIEANSVFYYQFAVLGLDYATVYTGMPSGINKARDQLTAKKPERDWKPELDKAAGLMRGVKSLPPRTIVEDKVVTLELQVAMINPDGSCR
ncbi:hypothetical protein [Oligoflexus tunisiensis]|uniref:hypothetical protein n=1 Tax=Oligoflexus tunisiensis TaxID=708132 RepID=UPI00114C900F|nr:hypothetical protein [Oligoflexus tunisiensis]